MGYSFFVCRVSGKVSTDANAEDIVIDGSYWRVTTSSDYDKCEDYDQYERFIAKNKKKGKLLVTELYYTTLCIDLIELVGDKRYLRRLIMADWSGFWKIVDRWVENRSSSSLMEEIRQYMY